jgi:hypothetical protein
MKRTWHSRNPARLRGNYSEDAGYRTCQPSSAGRVPVYDIRDLGFRRLILPVQDEMCTVFRRRFKHFGLPADEYAIRQLHASSPFPFSLRCILEINKRSNRNPRGRPFSPCIGHEHEPLGHIFLPEVRPQSGEQLMEVPNRILGDQHGR